MSVPSVFPPFLRLSTQCCTIALIEQTFGCCQGEKTAAQTFASSCRLAYSTEELRRAIVSGELRMNEDIFNMAIRKFLKKVGVTSQREIEQAVREAVQAGRLAGTETLKARMTLEVAGVNLELVIEDDLAPSE